MYEMTKGANVSLAALSEDTGTVLVGLSWSSPTGDGDADVSVLWLDAGGKVRGDEDFFFYNNPAAPDGSVQLLGKTPTAQGNEDRISVDLAATPPDVERVVVAASRYGGGRFGDLDDLRIAVALRGYRMSDVDDVLDRLGAELAERDARIAELETALAGAQQAALERQAITGRIVDGPRHGGGPRLGRPQFGGPAGPAGPSLDKDDEPGAGPWGPHRG